VTQEVVSFARVADIARRGGRERPDKTLFHFEGRTVDYRAFDANSSRAANGLIALGLKPDDRIAHIGKNSDLYFELLMAAAKAGGVMTPVNWRLALPEIAWIVADCGARILFVGPEFTDLVAANRDAFPGVEHVVAIEGAANGFADYRSWRDTFTDSDPDVPRGEPDAVIQMYTSGTTGKPKGAVLTNGSVLRSRLDRDPALLAEWERWEEEDVALVAMPCFHIGGTAYGISVMTNGATGVITREFDPAGVLDLIEAYHISKIFMVPAAMQTIVNQPRARSRFFAAPPHRLRRLADPARAAAPVHRHLPVRLRPDVRDDRNLGHDRRAAARGSRPRRERADAIDRQAAARSGDARHRSRRPSAAPARDRRDRDPRAGEHARILGASRGDGGDDRCRRLVAHR
jgi:fatty-acyl-CoA synthase